MATLVIVGGIESEEGVSSAAPAASVSPQDNCRRHFTRDEFRKKSRAVMMAPRLTGQGAALRTRIRCARRPQVNRPLMRRILASWRVWRKTTGRWRLTYGRFPEWVKVKLASIASCESHGSPTAISASGSYRGKYQFSYSTWGVVGGAGDPAGASESEQDVRAGWLLMKHGAGHWPVCGA